MAVPSINVLTHHNSKDPHIPHHGRTVAASFKLVINFFPLVGALGRGSAVIDKLPFIRATLSLGNKSRVVPKIGKEGTAVFGGGTRIRTRNRGTVS